MVKDAAHRVEVIDVCPLPPEVLSDSHHRLIRIETFECDELVRLLTRPGATVRDAAAEVG